MNNTRHDLSIFNFKEIFEAISGTKDLNGSKGLWGLLWCKVSPGLTGKMSQMKLLGLRAFHWGSHFFRAKISIYFGFKKTPQDSLGLTFLCKNQPHEIVGARKSSEPLTGAQPRLKHF